MKITIEIDEVGLLTNLGITKELITKIIDSNIGEAMKEKINNCSTMKVEDIEKMDEDYKEVDTDKEIEKLEEKVNTFISEGKICGEDITRAQIIIDNLRMNNDDLSRLEFISKFYDYLKQFEQ